VKRRERVVLFRKENEDARAKWKREKRIEAEIKRLKNRKREEEKVGAGLL